MASFLTSRKADVTAFTGRQIIARCRAGAKLCKALGRVGPVFTLQPAGLKVKTKYARAAIMSGKLRPARDGLFGGSSQTWIYPTAPTPSARSPSRARRI